MPYCAVCSEWCGPEKWRTLCPKHFRAQKKQEEEAAQQQIIQLLTENQDLRRQLREHGQVVVQNTGIPPEKLRALIQLCHPDKHNGSRAANELTQWLLSQKEKR